jgi:hypothetical protein
MHAKTQASNACKDLQKPAQHENACKSMKMHAKHLPKHEKSSKQPV